MMKRLMSLGLVLILLISMLAVPVFAEDGAGEGDGTSQGEGAGNPGGGSGEGTGNPGGSGEGTGNPGGSGEGSGNPGGSGEGTGNPGGSGEGSGNPGGSGEGSGNPGGSGEGSGNPGGSGEGVGNPGGGSGEGTGNPGGSGEGTGNPGGSGEGAGTECKHDWVYVEVEPTCTEYGAKGYYCTLCEGVADVVAIAPAHTYSNVCDESCDVCGATRTAEHKFSTQWSKSSTKHWHPCIGTNGCKARSGEADHYPGPAATEEKAQYCLTCGLMMMPKKSHVHDYATVLTSDATGHWYACSGCEEKKDFTAHTYDDLCDPDCNACGFTSETAHSFEENWESDETGHWSVCALCGEEKAPEAHTPGPEATDTEAQLCTVCGYELAPALIHVHKAGVLWQSDDTSHWHNCDCGEKTDLANHSWDEGVENEDTTVTYVCTVCQAEKTEGEPKTASEFPMWVVFLGIAILCGVAALVLILIMVIKNKPGKYKN